MRKRFLFFEFQKIKLRSNQFNHFSFRYIRYNIFQIKYDQLHFNQSKLKWLIIFYSDVHIFEANTRDFFFKWRLFLSRKTYWSGSFSCCVPEASGSRSFDRWGPSILVGHAVCAAEMFEKEVQLILCRLVRKLVEALLRGWGRLERRIII